MNIHDSIKYIVESVKDLVGFPKAVEVIVPPEVKLIAPEEDEILVPQADARVIVGPEKIKVVLSPEVVRHIRKPRRKTASKKKAKS